MAVEKEAFRAAMSRFPTGVTIVATRHDPEGFCGLTVNAFASVSLEPPLVLVSVDRASNTLHCIDRAGAFSVNVLADGQEALARRFAERREGKFDGVPHHEGALGLPFVEETVLRLACRVEAAHEGGDHTLFVARVEHAEHEDGPPLVFHRRAYRVLPDA